MQSTSTMPWMSLPENLRSGQRKIIESFFSKDSIVAKLPTGYGKTIAACGAYHVLKKRGIANRMLYVVPRRNQMDQAADGIPADLLSWFGVKTKSTIIGDEPIVSLKRHRNNTSEVFITTIQALATSATTWSTVKELMGNGKWFLVVDEYHNIPEQTNGERGKWIEKLDLLATTSRLAMSATPRIDANDPFPVPDVSVSYYKSFIDGCVKEMHLHEYEYRVDAIYINGDVVSYTTNEMDTDDGIQDALVSGKMRWSPKYISPLISIPAERIADQRINGIKTQMLVQATTCQHAEIVCTQVAAMLPTLNVDWVGTGPNGRSDRDNKAILKRFCPPKDIKTGRRKWDLDILVNVGMAGEGLDTQDVSEIVFLTPVNKTVSNMQAMGRAARIMYDVNRKQIDVVANINVDTETFIAEDDRYVGRKVMAIFDDDESIDEIPSKNKGDDEESDYKEMPDEPIVVRVDVSLIDIRKEPGFDDMLTLVKEKEGNGRTDEECVELVEDGMRRYLEQRDEAFNASSITAQIRVDIDHACSKIVSLVLRKISTMGMRFEKSLAGDLRRRLNSRKKRLYGSIKELDEPELTEQYKWLKSVEVSILRGEGIQGIPSWLR